MAAAASAIGALDANTQQALREVAAAQGAAATSGGHPAGGAPGCGRRVTATGAAGRSRSAAP
jgi:hypothetical protein